MVIKPLALFRRDAEQLSLVAKERNLVLAVGHDRPAVDKLRKCVRAGDLGRIVHAEGIFLRRPLFWFA